MTVSQLVNKSNLDTTKSIKNTRLYLAEALAEQAKITLTLLKLPKKSLFNLTE